MGYKLVNQDTVDKLRDILENEYLYKPIEMKINEFEVNINQVSQIFDSEHHPQNKMKEFYLLNRENNEEVLKYRNKLYDIFVNVGNWGTSPRLKKSHITFGSERFHSYSFQIEMAQSLEDDEHIYILKNISKLAGKGAMCRLYRGLKDNKDEKFKRRDKFVKEFGGDVIEYDDKSWIVICKIDKNKLNDDENKKTIFYLLLNNMIKAMLLVESIGNIK